ncbi:protein brambleberry-like [Macrobrachium rosenbergii]|uniref:protein brambleberry-like n=1 Tax=Macrobrachium rosenbergii TaxID=79674 RepID=UPI0034D447BB
MRVLYFAIFTISLALSDGALFSWLFKSAKSDKEQNGSGENSSGGSSTGHREGAHFGDVSTDVLAINVPFEARLSDEKFLMEAAEYTPLQLSELDKCHHRVILSLQTSCYDLTNEELSKVAVNLFNCQSYAEGRPVYPCNVDMTLEECTKNMDPNTWNAYHIVSNRVRAVCYATRQEQFRAKTEMTVNKLMNSAEQQVRSMNELQESQEALGKATSETFESLNEGHEYLRKQQNQLSAAQHTIQSYVSSNLRELYKEKRIIAAGQKELAHITESIKKKLDEAKSQLSVQEESQRDAHNHILEDLAEIQEDARRVWEKLDASTSNILLKHEETIERFSRLAQDLRDMNDTVHHLMDILHATRGAVEDKLSWISTLVGGTDNTVQKVYSCILHIAYFLIGMLAASFLQVPYLTRVVLVVLVPLNAMSEIKHESSLQFSTLTTVLALCVLINLLGSLLMGVFRKKEGHSSIRDAVLHCLKYELKGSPSDSVTVNGSTCINDLYSSTTIVTSTPPSNQNSVNHSSNTSNADYSSDEEELLKPVPKENPAGFLRKRIFGNSLLCSTEKDMVGSPVETKESVTSLLDCQSNNSKTHSDSLENEKAISSVRRHLLEQLENTRPPSHNLNFSLRSSSRRSTPMRETPSTSRSGTPSRSMTPKKLCAAACKNGQLCRNAAGNDSFYCHRHETSSILS